MLGGNFDATFKIVIVGNSGVGKTSLLLRFVTDQWKADTQPTLGVEFLTRVVALKNRRVQLQLWDTAGHELFRSITRSYYRGASGALIVFDLTHPDSFASVEQWEHDIRESTGDDLAIVLIGNKTDLVPDARGELSGEARAYADRHSLPYFETSARTGENIAAAVGELALDVERRLGMAAMQMADAQMAAGQVVAPVAERSCAC